MAVSLKKREKVDLSKPDTPPILRAYTPVHLIDEEETIRRPRQPPTPPQRLTKSDCCLKDNEIEVKPDNKKLQVERKHHRLLPENFQPLVMLAMVIAILTCIFVVVFLLTDRFSGIDDLPVESVPTENIPVESIPVENIPVESIPDTVTSSVASAESNFIGGTFEMFRLAFRYIRENPLALGMVGLSLLFLFISIVRKIFRMGRYDK